MITSSQFGDDDEEKGDAALYDGAPFVLQGVAFVGGAKGGTRVEASDPGTDYTRHLCHGSQLNGDGDVVVYWNPVDGSVFLRRESQYDAERRLKWLEAYGKEVDKAQGDLVRSFILDYLFMLMALPGWVPVRRDWVFTDNPLCVFSFRHIVRFEIDDSPRELYCDPEKMADSCTLVVAKTTPDYAGDICIGPHVTIFDPAFRVFIVPDQAMDKWFHDKQSATGSTVKSLAPADWNFMKTNACEPLHGIHPPRCCLSRTQTAAF